MYQLKSKDLSGLGGQVGSESTRINFRKYFTTEEAAKDYAEKDYSKNKGPINGSLTWHTFGSGGITTGDLGFVMYVIKKIKVEA